MKQALDLDAYKKGLSESKTPQEKIDFLSDVVEKLIDVLNKHNEVLHVQGNTHLSLQQTIEAILENIKNLNSRI